MPDDLIRQARALVARRAPGECERGLLHPEHIVAYCRVGERVTPLGARLAFVIADVEVAEPMRRQGVFRRMLEALESELPVLGVQALLVENISNPNLHAFLLRRGYLPTRPDGPELFPTLFKELTCPSTGTPATKTST